MPELESLLVVLLTLTGALRFSNVSFIPATGATEVVLAAAAAPGAPSPLDVLIGVLALAAGGRLTRLRITAAGVPEITVAFVPR